MIEMLRMKAEPNDHLRRQQPLRIRDSWVIEEYVVIEHLYLARIIRCLSGNDIREILIAKCLILDCNYLSGKIVIALVPMRHIPPVFRT